MLSGATIYYLQDLQCVLHYPGNAFENFVIEAPNGGGMFSIRLSQIGECRYRDKNDRMRKGTRNYRVILSFSYDNHRMELSKLLASEYIVFDFGDLTLPFTNERFKFNAEEITKNWFESIPITAGNLPEKNANPFPSGGFDAEFISFETWSSP